MEMKSCQREIFSSNIRFSRPYFKSNAVARTIQDLLGERLLMTLTFKKSYAWKTANFLGEKRGEEALLGTFNAIR